MTILRALGLSLTLLSATGCDLLDPNHDLYGQWQADKLTIAGIGLPVSPNIEFRPETALVDGTAQAARYTRKDKTLTVTLQSGVSFEFTVQDDHSLSIALPLLGNVTYRKVP